jgi:hypothetical protein
VNDAHTHLLKRIEHALHWSATQGCVAVKGNGYGRARYRADREPNTGAGIAEIEHASRLCEPANADTMNAPGMIPGALDTSTKCPHCVSGVQDVLALQ